MNNISNLAFTKEEFKQRIKKVQQEMQKNGIDVFLCFVFQNINYLTGIESIGYYGYGLFMVLVTEDGAEVLTKSPREFIIK